MKLTPGQKYYHKILWNPEKDIPKEPLMISCDGLLRNCITRFVINANTHIYLVIPDMVGEWLLEYPTGYLANEPTRVHQMTPFEIAIFEVNYAPCLS